MQATASLEPLLRTVEGITDILNRPAVRNFLVRFKIGYNFDSADSIITPEEREAHNPNCWIRNGIPVSANPVIKLHATPFLTWLEHITDHDVSNFKTRHTLNEVSSRWNADQIGVLDSLKEIRHRITHGESKVGLNNDMEKIAELLFIFLL